MPNVRKVTVERSTVMPYLDRMTPRASDIADTDNALDLARHTAKRRLLAEVQACNVAHIEPSKALVVRLASRGRRESGRTRSRWYILIDELADAGYLHREITAAGYRLTVSEAGRRALEAAS